MMDIESVVTSIYMAQVYPEEISPHRWSTQSKEYVSSPLTWPGQNEPHFTPHSAEASLLPLHVRIFFPVHGQVMLSYVEEGVKV